jgi:Cyclin
MSSALACYHTVVSAESLTSEYQGRGPRYWGNLKSWQSLAQDTKFGSCFASGLPTPPETRAMNGVGLNQYNHNAISSQNYYPSKLPYPGYPTSNTTEVRSHQSNAINYNNASSTTQLQAWHATRGKEDIPEQKEHSESDSTIASYLQIPSSINDSKGSLAEFAAEITCLFWFESAATLQKAEEPPSLSGTTVKPLAPDAFPTMGFLKWVTTILSTTQVTQNVILLALLFIHRLKKFNPSVSGKKGSEYRLLTIALMLGNKFLDDNTYTNKTWAEVSGISVSEIHIMEVEFLSNMRYNLYVSEGEWKRWHVKLARFSGYFNRASKAPAIEITKAAPITPLSQTFPYKLPSPPSPARHGAPLPMYQPSLPNPLAMAPYLSHSPSRHHYEQDHPLNSRKRSLDVSSDIPPAKRFMSSTPSNHSPAVPSPATLSAYTPGSNASSGTLPDLNHISPIPKLPVPNVAGNFLLANRPQPYLAPLSLPLGRAMSMVYPNTSNNWSQPVTPIGTMPPSSANLYANPIPALGEMTRSQYASANASPAGYGSVTPSRQMSPSYFLTNRNSPYRPVRSVNTLLIPPPSASLHNPSRNIGLDQMRYQPLAKAPTESRAGVVPYLHHETWPQSWTGAPPMPSQYAFHA